MDLISNMIYNDTDHVDFLCSLNNIINPLSIRKGMLIMYVAEEQILQFKVAKINKDDIRKLINNQRKRSKTDPNRTKYLETMYSLPPTITKSDYKPIKHTDGKIHIGGNIFNI